MTWWFWIVLGLALLGLELAMPGGFFLVFFGAAALLLGGLVLLVPDLHTGLEWIVFSVLSVVMLLAFRKKLIGMLRSSPGEAIDSLIGQEVEVTEAMAPGSQGSVSLRGAPWKAENVGAVPLGVSSRGRVMAVDGLLLKVGSI